MDLKNQMACEKDRDLVDEAIVNAYFFATSIQPFNIDEMEKKYGPEEEAVTGQNRT